MSNHQHTLESTLHAQPWRSGVGLPKNALDPTWNGELRDSCRGEIHWEGISTWWFCAGCGYISHGGYTVHKPIMHPGLFYLTSMFFFWMKKMAEGLSPEDTMSQMMYVSGVALRQAAVIPPARLERYVAHIAAPVV